jgi:preprotein translocase subunit SecE
MSVIKSLRDNGLFRFIRESFIEVRDNVTWSKIGELYSSTTLVVVASLIFAVVIRLIDITFEWGLQTFYDKIINK